MQEIINNFDQYLQAALSLFAALVVIARFTPTPKDDKILGKIYDLISSVTPNDRSKEDKK